jgi:predicted transcriptional regulator
MVYLFIGSRGGQNRVRIVESLKGEPSNSNQLSEKLGLDYKTIQHHLKLLEQNGVIVPSAKGSYGAVFFLTPYFERYFDSVREIWAKFGQSKK